SLAYNGALKKTAAYTTDRSVLFDYITSDDFLQDRISGQISRRYRAMEKEKEKEEDISEALKMKHSEADQVLDPYLFEEVQKTEELSVSEQAIPSEESLSPEEGKTESLEAEKTSDAPKTDPEIEPEKKPVKFDKTQEHSFSD